jgi:hypothetical protein
MSSQTFTLLPTSLRHPVWIFTLSGPRNTTPFTPHNVLLLHTVAFMEVESEDFGMEVRMWIERWRVRSFLALKELDVV